MIGQDPYYSRPEVSNSDLSALKNYFMPKDYVMDVTAAYRFGNLIDSLITEAHRCDHYNLEWMVSSSPILNGLMHQRCEKHF
jgi:hypothetical protein